MNDCCNNFVQCEHLHVIRDLIDVKVGVKFLDCFSKSDVSCFLDLLCVN